LIICVALDKARRLITDLPLIYFLYAVEECGVIYEYFDIIKLEYSCHSNYEVRCAFVIVIHFSSLFYLYFIFGGTNIVRSSRK
jgi:hypothetical protein